MKVSPFSSLPSYKAPALTAQTQIWGCDANGSSLLRTHLHPHPQENQTPRKTIDIRTSPSDKEIDPTSRQINHRCCPVIKPKTYSLPLIKPIGMIRRKQEKTGEPSEQECFRRKLKGRL
jgi:hypothetical protein